jgi:hypothetical protein
MRHQQTCKIEDGEIDNTESARSKLGVHRPVLRTISQIVDVHMDAESNKSLTWGMRRSVQPEYGGLY